MISRARVIGGSVTGFTPDQGVETNVGGLVGQNPARSRNPSPPPASPAIGLVETTMAIGGLVGQNGDPEPRRRHRQRLLRRRAPCTGAGRGRRRRRRPRRQQLGEGSIIRAYATGASRPTPPPAARPGASSARTSALIDQTYATGAVSAATAARDARRPRRRRPRRRDAGARLHLLLGQRPPPANRERRRRHAARDRRVPEHPRLHGPRRGRRLVLHRHLGAPGPRPLPRALQRLARRLDGHRRRHRRLRLPRRLPARLRPERRPRGLRPRTGRRQPERPARRAGRRRRGGGNTPSPPRPPPPAPSASPIASSRPTAP